MAAGMDHLVTAPNQYAIDSDIREDWARTTVVCSLQPGQKLRLIKYLGYGWSGERSEPAVRDQVAAALTGARGAGWDGLADAQRQYLASIIRSWRRPVVKDGLDGLSVGARFLGAGFGF